MGLGLQGSYGASAVQEGLRNRIIDQLKQQQAQQQMAMQAQEMQLRQQQEGRIGEEHAAAMQDRRAAEADRVAQNYDRGTNVIDEATMPGRYEASNPIMGRLVKAGAATPVDERPRVDVGPLQPGDSGGALAAGFLKRATTKQADTQSAADAKVEAARLAAENRTNDNEQHQLDRLAQIKASAASRPVPDKLTKVEHRDEATGKTVTEWLPQSELRGKQFAKGASATTETRLASAEAVNQTGDDIIKQLADPKIAAMVGPAMGRYNTLRDFVGNPPPELADLAGSIESYAIANMGVHGMRSAAGAEQIKKLLDKKHTPESMTATIRGLSKFSNHFMENEGRKPTTSSGGGGKDPLGIR